MKSVWNNDVYYYRIVGCHKELVGDEVPVNIWQLYKIIGSERKPDSNGNYKPCIADHYASYARLGDIICIGSAVAKINDDMKKHYPWEKLIQSIKERGILKPTLLERISLKNRVQYHAIEGRHRLTACTQIEPFNKDMLVPAIIVDIDGSYTEYMHDKKHPSFTNEYVIGKVLVGIK